MNTAVLVRAVLLRRALGTTGFIRRRWLLIGIALALAIFVYANSRMVYLAFAFQPDCISHQKQGTSGVTAAKSSC